jgi:hypothetical protein
MVYTLLKCGEHLHGRVIALGGDVYTRKLVPVANQESERSCISVFVVMYFVVMYFCVCGHVFCGHVFLCLWSCISVFVVMYFVVMYFCVCGHVFLCLWYHFCLFLRFLLDFKTVLFFWSLCCVSFDLRIMITPLLSSNYSKSKIYL